MGVAYSSLGQTKVVYANSLVLLGELVLFFSSPEPLAQDALLRSLDVPRPSSVVCRQVFNSCWILTNDPHMTLY